MCVFVLAARRKLLERARQAGLGGFKKTSVTIPTVKEMWDGEESKLTYYSPVYIFLPTLSLKSICLIF